MDPLSRMVHISVHDASPIHAEALDELHGILDELGAESYSMLVIPDYHGEHPLQEAPGFCEWLREKKESGVEMVLHGYTHLATGRPVSPRDRIRAALFTRGEGEFLELREDEAGELLRRGRDMLQRVLGGDPIDGFVAPAWLYGRGTIAALNTEGFGYTEDRFRQWDPLTGETILHSPVLNFAGGGVIRRTTAAAWVHAALVLMRRAETVRFALHPCDIRRRVAVLKVLGALLDYRRSVSSRSLPPVSG